MGDREFRLRLGISKEFPRTRTDNYCHYSDGLNECTCVKKKTNSSMEDCGFYGRSLEPLAFYLPSYSEVYQQNQSQFYLIPKEIRDLIFEYALIDDGVPTFNCDNVFRRNTRATIFKVDSACALLQTCKAVYLEAYRLPMLLNGYMAYRTNLYYGRHDGSRWDSPSRPDLGRIAPWQYALIQRIDLSLQQTSIESRLLNELQLWQPALRHSGAYVSPRFYNTLHSYSSRKAPEISAHNFALVPATPENSAKGIEDGNKVSIERWDDYPSDDPEDRQFGGKYRVIGSFTASAMVARRITHLTLRMSRTDWWTWEDDPSSADSDKQLALDPSRGGKYPRPFFTDMLGLANARRAGQHPQCDKTWGAAIESLPDLKTFELVLETFSPKKTQLEMVVECARTWKFSLKGTQYELECDHKIDTMQWTIPPPQDSSTTGHRAKASGDHTSLTDTNFMSNKRWVRACTEFEVRVVRFRRTRAHVGS